MTKEKLLEFYNKLKQEEIKVSIIRQFRNCSDKQLDIIMNSKYPKIMMDIIINYEFKLLSETEQEEIINLVNNSQNEQIALGMYHIIASGMILSSKLTTKIIKIIDESSIEVAPYIISLALNTIFLMNPNSLEIMKIIGKSQKEYQASCAADIAKSIEALVNDDVIEIIKIASKTEGEKQSKLVNAIAKNRDVLASNLVIKLTTLASKTNTELIDLIISIASDKLLEKNRYSTYYLTKMLEAQTDEEIVNIYNDAQQKIIFFKIQESQLKKDNTFFWNIYKNRPKKAIESFQMISEDEITPYTRIRSK